MTDDNPQTNYFTAYDLMDLEEVATAFGVTRSNLSTAMLTPPRNKSLAERVPAPLRRIGNAWVWARFEVEEALAREGM